MCEIVYLYPTTFRVSAFVAPIQILECMVKELKVSYSDSFRIDLYLCWNIYAFQSSNVWIATHPLFCTASQERVILGAIIPETELSARSVQRF